MTHKIILSILFLFPKYLYSGQQSSYEFSYLYVIPFIGILLSIALFPLINEHFWHNNFGKISAFWALLFSIPFMMNAGISYSMYYFTHAIFLEYIPFIVLLLALFTISGGILIKGDFVGTPKFNLILLFIGTSLASWMGTTGAAMLLIRPLIRANKWREEKTHIIIFFIFLVANIGGSLTPLGDPPLFIGFLKGVDFFWTTKYMLMPMIFVSIFVLVIAGLMALLMTRTDFYGLLFHSWMSPISPDLAKIGIGDQSIQTIIATLIGIDNSSIFISLIIPLLICAALLKYIFSSDEKLSKIKKIKR